MGAIRRARIDLRQPSGGAQRPRRRGVPGVAAARSRRPAPEHPRHHALRRRQPGDPRPDPDGGRGDPRRGRPARALRRIGRRLLRGRARGRRDRRAQHLDGRPRAGRALPPSPRAPRRGGRERFDHDVPPARPVQHRGGKVGRPRAGRESPRVAGLRRPEGARGCRPRRRPHRGLGHGRR